MKKLQALVTAALATTLLSTTGATTLQRQHILVVGSSTAFPIVAYAAEHVGKHSKITTPVVESTGTGGGIKMFCSGLGLHTPDISMASRSMTPSERSRCEKMGVTDIREIKIGFDGIVFANHRHAPRFDLSKRDLYLAMARWVPVTKSSDKLVDNPYTHWHQINNELPNLPIRVMGPPPTSGTRDILLERLMTDACSEFPALARLHKSDPKAFSQRCHTLREDGAYINAGENDARLVRKLINDHNAIGIFGYSFLDSNRDHLQAASVEGILPRFELIESGTYPLARPLYLYVKPRHNRVVKGLNQFVDMLVSNELIGDEGILIDQGLIPLPEPQ